MALDIENAEIERLALELAAITGESPTSALLVALRGRLASLRRPPDHNALHLEIAQLQAFVATLPDRDTRTPDEILGYDQFGCPT